MLRSYSRFVQSLPSGPVAFPAKGRKGPVWRQARARDGKRTLWFTRSRLHSGDEGCLRLRGAGCHGSRLWRERGFAADRDRAKGCTDGEHSGRLRAPPSTRFPCCDRAWLLDPTALSANPPLPISPSRDTRPQRKRRHVVRGVLRRLPSRFTARLSSCPVLRRSKPCPSPSVGVEAQHILDGAESSATRWQRCASLLRQLHDHQAESKSAIIAPSSHRRSERDHANAIDYLDEASQPLGPVAFPRLRDILARLSQALARARVVARSAAKRLCEVPRVPSWGAGGSSPNRPLEP